MDKTGLVWQLASIVVKKIELPPHPYDAGERAREAFLEVEKYLKDTDTSKLSEPALQLTLNVLGKDEVNLKDEDYPEYRACDVYRWIIGDLDSSATKGE